MQKVIKVLILISIAAAFTFCGSVYAVSPKELFDLRCAAKMNPTRWVAGCENDPGMFGNVLFAAGSYIAGSSPQDSSALNSMGNTIAGLYGGMPASSQLALEDWGSTLGVVKPAYAQGTGFSGLRVIKNIADIFRNVALVAYILIFLAVGFMIMFRFRIDPRTVVSIQNALPRLILTFALVWLSYPIAGFLIDLMYVVSFLFFGLFQAIGMDVSSFRNNYQGETVFHFFFNNFGFGGITQTASSVAHIIGQILGGGLTGGLAYGVAWVLAWLIILVAILFAVFRTFLQLLTAYIMVLFGVIFAPFWIGAGGIPLPLGSVGVGGWLRHMLGHLAAFPTVGVLYMLGTTIVSNSASLPLEQGWVAPLIGAGYGPGAIQALIGLGIIMLTPVAVQMTKDFFKSPEFKYLAAIQQGIGTGRAVAFAPAAVPLAMAIHTLQWRGGEWIGEKLGLFRGRTDYPPPSGEKKEEHP